MGDADQQYDEGQQSVEDVRVQAQHPSPCTHSPITQRYVTIALVDLVGGAQRW